MGVSYIIVKMRDEIDRGKRGQIAVFVIIGVIIVAIITLLLINRNYFNRDKIEVSSIRGFVESCIEKEGIGIIYEVGRKGGYYFAPEPKIDSGIPIYYKDGETYVPDKEEIEKEISFYLEKKLFFCTKNFVDFPDFEIKQGEIEVDADMGNEKIELKVEYPLKVERGENVVLLEDFEIDVDVRLGILYESAKQFALSSGEEGYCLTCLLELSLENDFFVDTLDYDTNTVIFIFRDEDYKLNDKTTRFVFAIKNV